MLAAVDRHDSQDFPFQFFCRAEFTARYEPENWPAQIHGNHPERHTTHNASHGAAYRAQSIQFPCYAGGDRCVGTHANQLRLETFFTEKTLFPGDVKLYRWHARARHADAEFLRRRLSAGNFRAE